MTELKSKFSCNEILLYFAILSASFIILMPNKLKLKLLMRFKLTKKLFFNAKKDGL